MIDRRSSMIVIIADRLPAAFPGSDPLARSVSAYRARANMQLRSKF
jgi:hypothetical protein